MLMMWHRWSSRSGKVTAMTSSPRILPHSSKPLFEVSTVEAWPQRRLMSWKRRTAPLWVARQVADLVDDQKRRVGSAS